MGRILSRNAFLVALLFLIQFLANAQTSDCNKLGVWLWHFETTGFSSHAQLADSLSSYGIKRIIAKVADGRVDTTFWPEIVDKQLVNDYRSKGIETWAWSYNYPGNDSMQAEALYLAAKTGYQGFVVDVEEKFDGDSYNLFNLFSAFYAAKIRAINDGFAADSFTLNCTTWGNPAYHDFRIDVIDPFVDGFLPQTYVEVWGTSYMNNITYWIGVRNQEYRSLGATKPIHHIVSTEKNIITASQINEFIEASGPQTSVWRIPGGGVPTSVWDTWRQVDWHFNFCNHSNVTTVDNANSYIFPNPVAEKFTLRGFTGEMFPMSYKIVDVFGRTVKAGEIDYDEEVSVSDFSAGLYILILQHGKKQNSIKLIKN